MSDDESIAASSPAGPYYRGTIVRVYYGSDSGILRSEATGREYRFKAPLVEVARVMCDGHWHRVPVVDDGGALCGIISTMDVLAALVNAADESA